jgi:hypothetical protein
MRCLSRRFYLKILLETTVGARRVAHPLNSELALDFSGAPPFAVLAKGGCFGFFLSFGLRSAPFHNEC